MDIAESCPAGDTLLMFMDSALPAAIHEQVATHLTHCPVCREEVAFIERVRSLLRHTEPSTPEPVEACPSSETLVAYQAGTLDEETCQHVRAHLLYCDACCADMLALEQSLTDEVPFGTALTRYLEHLRAAPRPLAYAAAGVTRPRIPGYVLEAQRTSERLDLEVLYGPHVSAEGHLSLDMQIPDGERFEGRTAMVRLQFATQRFDISSRVERSTITVDYTFAGGFQELVSPPQLQAALLDALEVRIL